jgi:small conductance mechanosensitive channel
VVSSSPSWIERLDDLHLLTPLRIVLTVAVAWGLTVLVRHVVRRLVSRTIGLPGVDPARAEARQRALVGALRGVVVGVIWTVAIITVVSQLGINIGAFVATATVVGGAAAFGAQQLVRDVIAGLFVLAEDQYGVGDEVDLGLASGTVERITLRSVRLNDGDGRIWTVPHGGVPRSANLSKESAALLDIEVARTMAYDELMAEAGALCAALAADPAVAALLVAPPAVVGVVKITDDRLACRVKMRTLPTAVDAVKSAMRVLVVRSFEAGRLLVPVPSGPVVQVHTSPVNTSDD